MTDLYPPLNSNLATLLEAWLMLLNTFHSLLTGLILWCIIRIIIFKDTPYSQLTVSGLIVVQLVWNGCPVTDFVNMFNRLGNYELEPNQFFWGIGGSYTQWFRLFLMLIFPIIFTNSYSDWEKIKPSVHFGRFFKKGKFQFSKKLNHNYVSSTR